MTLSLRSSDQLRHDVWVQIEALDGRLTETTDPVLRQILQGHRDHFCDMLAAAPVGAPVVINEASQEQGLSDVELSEAWRQILGEAGPALEAIPVL